MVDLNHYILEDGQPKAVDWMTWAAWLETDKDFSKRRVAKTFVGDSEISTVFLMHNHRWSGEGAPILFETLVFGGALDMEMDRYETLEQAMLGHEKMVAAVRAGKLPDDGE